LNKSNNLCAFVIIGILGFVLLLTVFENNGKSSLFERLYISVWAQDDDGDEDGDGSDHDWKNDDDDDDDYDWDNDDSNSDDDDDKDKDKDNDEDNRYNDNEQKERSVVAADCNKLLSSEICEKIQEDGTIENEKLKPGEKAILSKYIETIETEQTPIDNTVNKEVTIGISNSNNSGTNSNQRIENESISNQTNRPSVVNPTVSNIPPQQNNLDQSQLIEQIASTISNANNVDKNKITQSLNDLIEQTKATGGNVIESLKKIAETISNNPSGIVAKRIINTALQDQPISPDTQAKLEYSTANENTVYLRVSERNNNFVWTSNIDQVNPELVLESGKNYTIQVESMNNNIPHQLIIQDEGGKQLANSIEISNGETDDFPFTFSNTGKYQYYCQYHPKAMQGNIVIS
jgi:hypothetical protein